MKAPPKVPRFIAKQYGGARRFRAQHREAIRNAIYWLDRARNGCAYSPAHQDLRAAAEALDRARACTRTNSWDKRAAVTESERNG